jgi:heat shock protein HslJ
MQKRIISLRVLIQGSFILATVAVALSFSFPLFVHPKSSSIQLPAMSSENSLQPSVLDNSSWQLECWEHQGSAVTLVPQTEISLRFKSNQVNGFGSCNFFSGFFTIVEDQLSLGTLETTQRGCAAVVMNQESQFLGALQSVRRMTSDASGRLVLSYTSNAGQGTLYFAPTR